MTLAPSYRQRSQVISHQLELTYLLISLIIQLGGAFFQYEPYLSVFSCDSVSSCGSSANAVSSGTFYCDELRDVESVTIQCPFTYRSDFQGIVAIWSIIFGGYIVYYLAMTSWYSTWDLRYYIAEHHFKVHIISTVWKVIAISFTLVCTIYAFWSVKSQDSSYGFAYNDAMLYMSTILFAVFNTVGILSFFKLHPSFTGYKDHTMKSFPDFIALKHVKEPTLINLYGGLILGGDVLTILELAVAKSAVEHTIGVEKYCVSADDATKAVTALKTMEIL